MERWVANQSFDIEKSLIYSNVLIVVSYILNQNSAKVKT